MDDDELLRAAASTLASWHDVSVRALGWYPTTTEDWWSCPTPAPNIYHSAVSLRPGRKRRDRDRLRTGLRAHLDDPGSVAVSVCDSWDELGLDRLGLTRRAASVWSARPPGPVAPDADPSTRRRPTGLRIEHVTDDANLIDFERTVVLGFGARMAIAPFDIHGRGILADPAMHVLLGRAEDRAEAVAVSMAYVTPDVVGIYGVATVPGARGRGYATEMTIAALLTAPDRTAILQPSAEARSLYRRLGFTDIGSFSHWT